MPALEEYQRRLTAREARARELARLHERIGNVRLVLVLLAIIVAWGALFKDAFPAGWLIVPIGAFFAVVSYHSTVRAARALVERAAGFYRHGIARMEDRWIGLGSQGERFADPHHVYAADLDLFGRGSLFELLSSARTRMGEQALAGWLLTPSPLEQIRERHAAISDLAERLDFREEIAVLGDSPGIGVHPDALLAWAEAPDTLTNRWIQAIAVLLPVLSIASAIVWSIWGFATPFVAVAFLAAGVIRWAGKPLMEALRGTETAFEDLKLFSALLLRMEREPFSAAPLRERVRRLSSHTLSASRTLERLSRIVELIEARRNIGVATLNVPLMYSVNTVLAAERWRRAHGKVVREWVNALGELEALISLAAYRHEHPEDVFPEFVAGPATFDASDLGHPLISAAQCVRNSVSTRDGTRVLLVSGSNMSGKSTLLRSVGINTVLAMAGAPVRARTLRLTPLQVGASIRVNDSLHEGSSRFYAEILRLRHLNELLDRELPLLFLLDELLQGTNSRDRRIGAEGIVRAFVERGAIGFISTHDLALTDIGGLSAGALRNVHFQDELLDGQMRFDFKLRDGIVTRSNGIELMRAVGLKV